MRYTIEIVSSIDDIDEAALQECIDDSVTNFERDSMWESYVQSHCDSKGITLDHFKENGDNDGLTFNQKLKDQIRSSVTGIMSRDNFNSYFYVGCIKDTENSNRIMGYTQYIRPNGEPNILLLMNSAVRNGDNGLKTWLYTFWADCRDNFSQSMPGQLGIEKQSVLVASREMCDFFLNSSLGFELREGSSLPSSGVKQRTEIIWSGWGWS
jgi:hypothetical protein